jgi:hypothetical protein
MQCPPWVCRSKLHSLHDAVDCLQDSIDQLLTLAAAAELGNQLACCKVGSAQELVGRHCCFAWYTMLPGSGGQQNAQTRI